MTPTSESSTSTRQKFGSFCTQLNEMKIDRVDGRLLYATNADGNSFLKVDLATGQVIENLVLNDESNSPHLILRRPGTSRAYVLLSRTNEALEIDLDRAEVIRTVQFPLTRTDFLSFGAAFRDSETLLVAQGEYLLELAADLTLRARHNLPKGAPGVWKVIGSERWEDSLLCHQQHPERRFIIRTLSSPLIPPVSRSKQLCIWTAETSPCPGSIRTPASFTCWGGRRMRRCSSTWLTPRSLSLRKTIRFDDPDHGGIMCSSSYPYAYDPGSRTLFVASSLAILAIDTDRDEIKRVMPPGCNQCRLRSSGPAQQSQCGMTFHPVENRLYLAHGDGALRKRVRSRQEPVPAATLLDVKGYCPGWLLPNDDVSKIWVANREIR